MKFVALFISLPLAVILGLVLGAFMFVTTFVGCINLFIGETDRRFR